MRLQASLLVASLSIALVEGCETAPVPPTQTGLARASAHAAEDAAFVATRLDAALSATLASAHGEALAPPHGESEYEILIGPSTGGKESIVAATLAELANPRATSALIAWAVDPSTPGESKARIFWEMATHPRAVYLDVVRRTLADPEERVVPVIVPYVLFRLGIPDHSPGGLRAHSLQIAGAIGNVPSRELLRSVALDRTLPSPDPALLAALRCKNGDGWVLAGC